MKKALIIMIAVALAVFAVYILLPKSGTDNGSLDPARISQEVSEGRAVLLDVRTAQERNTDGYATGSTHFDLARLQNNQLPNILNDTKVYVYCKGGIRAGKAKVVLEENGFADVVNIGGLVDWENAGGEVVR